MVLAEKELSDRLKEMPAFLLGINHHGSCPILTDKGRSFPEESTNLIYLLKAEGL
jgi:hypothetical protein